MQPTCDEHVRLNKPLKRLRRRVVSLADASAGDRVLDVGTGTGAQAFAFAEIGATVTGVDMDPAELAEARRKNRFAHVSFVDANATDLPFPDGVFDIACACLVLHELPAAVRYEVLAEMTRVTRPGGRIVVVERVLPSNAHAAAWIDRVLGLVEGKHRVGFVHSDLRALFEAAGLVIQTDERAFFGAVRIVIASAPSPDPR